MFMTSIHQETTTNPDLVITDVSNLMPVKVKEVVQGHELESIKQVIEEANEKNLKISIAGKQHSMGGHTYYKNSVVLDMTSYNQILDFDSEGKTITVQSGTTWDDIQQYINPHGLAIKVMQSQNIFTIGGSISVNAHGRDIRYGSLIDTVRSFRLLTADGKTLNVSREENEELFYLALGGYGLFGVILDVTLGLTDDELYKLETEEIDYKEYSDYFINNVKENPDVRMHLARISTAPDSFLTEMYVTNYELAAEQQLEQYNELKGERYTAVTKFALGLARDFDWGKNVFWEAQKKYFLETSGKLMTRNNVMRSESDFLEYDSKNDTDVLQEYFVPVENFSTYIDDLRELLSEEDLNLINITIRYVNEDEDAVLSYAKDDMFALVLLINQGLSDKDKKETKRIVQKMVDITLKHNGSYYLPYMLYPTKKQMYHAYPRAEEFFKKKLKYDPNERFYSLFYERYK
ncbi:FAD-binding oxidoreductase [Alkalihalobacillus sp. AL-G]|nr:FAD-binding oxidoreductase [Alkalihalobacillus sp. AL-G]WLD95343.1 FAD-binding oxidoreductase [Alkalihalobacillus sp. AL-G]